MSSSEQLFLHLFEFQLFLQEFFVFKRRVVYFLVRFRDIGTQPFGCVTPGLTLFQCFYVIDECLLISLQLILPEFAFPDRLSLLGNHESRLLLPILLDELSVVDSSLKLCGILLKLLFISDHFNF